MYVAGTSQTGRLIRKEAIFLLVLCVPRTVTTLFYNYTCKLLHTYIHTYYCTYRCAGYTYIHNIPCRCEYLINSKHNYYYDYNNYCYVCIYGDWLLFVVCVFAACRYEKGTWSECNAQSEMTRNDKLKANSDASCEQNRQITKKCKGKSAKPTKGNHIQYIHAYIHLYLKLCHTHM